MKNLVLGVVAIVGLVGVYGYINNQGIDGSGLSAAVMNYSKSPTNRSGLTSNNASSVVNDAPMYTSTIQNGAKNGQSCYGWNNGKKSLGTTKTENGVMYCSVSGNNQSFGVVAPKSTKTMNPPSKTGTGAVAPTSPPPAAKINGTATPPSSKTVCPPVCSTSVKPGLVGTVQNIIQKK